MTSPRFPIPPRYPFHRRVTLAELAELCGDDAEALYWLSQMPNIENLEDARRMLEYWSKQMRPYLTHLEEAYRNGDATAAFRALQYANVSCFPVPYWAADALSHAWGAYVTWQPGADSINDALGVKRKGAKPFESRREILLGYCAARLVWYHHEKENRHITKALYADVAKEILNPSMISHPQIRKEVEWGLDWLREEFGEPLSKLSGTTVGRWYEGEKRRRDRAKREKDTATEKKPPRFPFIFDKSKK